MEPLRNPRVEGRDKQPFRLSNGSREPGRRLPEDILGSKPREAQRCGWSIKGFKEQIDPSPHPELTRRDGTQQGPTTVDVEPLCLSTVQKAKGKARQSASPEEDNGLAWYVDLFGYPMDSNHGSVPPRVKGPPGDHGWCCITLVFH